MENTMTPKKEQKQNTKKNNISAIRVSKVTGKLAQQAREKANDKTYGKSVKLDRILAVALGKLTQDDYRELQEGSLSNEDRFERDFAAYCSEHGKVSKDEYLGLVMSGVAKSSSVVKKAAENS